VTLRRLRPVALLVGACVMAAAAGCYSGADYAADHTLRLSAGMSMQEVQDRLGEPDLTIRGDPGTETVWVYRYEGGPSVACVVIAVIFVVAIIAVLVLAKGGGSSGGSFGGSGGGDDPPYQIKLLFDQEGRLLEVSPPHPVPNPQ
jgi:hypothetical protein